VLADSGQPLKEALIKRLRKADILKVQVFVPSGRAESIADTQSVSRPLSSTAVPVVSRTPMWW